MKGRHEMRVYVNPNASRALLFGSLTDLESNSPAMAWKGSYGRVTGGVFWARGGAI